MIQSQLHLTQTNLSPAMLIQIAISDVLLLLRMEGNREQKKLCLVA